MATPTHDLISSTTLSSSTSSLTINNIDQSYRDLIIIAALTVEVAQITPNYRLNEDTNSNYIQQTMVLANIEGSNSFTDDFFYLDLQDIYISDRFLSIIQIMDYSQTNKHKNTINKSSNISSNQETVFSSVGRYKSLSAVSAITFFPSFSSGELGAGTNISIYGIAG